jgi:hypothetical protein
MRAFFLTLVAGATFAIAGMAQSPVTATCKDGTSFTGTKRSGACHGHGGVQTWTTSSTTAPATTTSAAPSSTTTASPTPATSPKTTATPAPGGGSGQVWVNTASHVYHCPGTQWYGTTKKGQYMTEEAAKAAGNHADHGKACS